MMNNSRKRAERRRRIAAVTAILIAVAMALMSTVMVAVADEREDAVAKQRESQRKIDELNSSLSSIDSELEELFVAMEQTNIDVGVAQEDLIVAQETLAAAQRHLQQVTDELEDAEALQAELVAEIEESKLREDQLASAVGSMAREMYRGDNVTPLQIVVQAEDMGDVSTRAAAATALSRAQSRALDDVRSGLVVTENQALKQDAVTERITELKEEAERAYIAADAAQTEVENRIASLETLQAEQTAAQARWEARKGDVQEQLEAADKELANAAARVAEIDLSRERRAAAASRASASSGGSGGASTSAPSTSGSGLLSYPFSSNQPITSHFGYRLHPVFGISLLHNGTDWGAACGVPQLATRSGTVSAVGYTSTAGNYVQINHGVVNGRHYITNHSHAQRVLVSVGQRVSAGTPVALTGTTGASTGCHLHFTLFQDGVPVNPLPYM